MQGNPVGKPKKRKRAIPEGLSEHDAKILTKVKRRAYRLDQSMSILGIKVGWSALVGLIPGFGDALDMFMALMVVNTAKGADLDSATLNKMYLNVAIDFLIGLVPFLGDFADALFRCNTKNAVLLEKMLVQRAEKAMKAQGETFERRPTGIMQQQQQAIMQPEFVRQQEIRHDDANNGLPPPRYEEAARGRADTTNNGNGGAPMQTVSGQTARKSWWQSLGGGKSSANTQPDVERGEGSQAAPSLPQRPVANGNGNGNGSGSGGTLKKQQPRESDVRVV